MHGDAADEHRGIARDERAVAVDLACLCILQLEIEKVTTLCDLAITYDLCTQFVQLDVRTLEVHGILLIGCLELVEERRRHAEQRHALLVRTQRAAT